MAYSRSYSIPTANTTGGAAPPSGTTGSYLWEDTREWRSNQVSDEPIYPGQLFILRETVQAFYEIYNHSLVQANERYYVPKYYLGTWQALSRGTQHKVLSEGKSRYLVTTIERDNYFTAGYKLEDGYTDYGLIKLSQCNFSLEPSTPIAFEIAGVEIEFATYEVPTGRGTLLSGSYAIDRAYPRNDRAFQLEIGKIGFYTYQGAALNTIEYYVRQIHNCPGEAYSWRDAFCPKR